MNQKNVEELNKKLKTDSVCTIVALVAVIIIVIMSFATYITTKNIESLNEALYALISTIVLAILASVFGDVKKKGSPFTKSVVNKLRVMAVCIMLAAFVPDIVCQFADMANGVTEAMVFEIVFASKALFIMWTGVIIGTISEIFKYGMRLQEDVDSIL